MSDNDGAASQLNPPEVQARSVESFVDSIGVVTHIDSGLPNWLDASLVENEVAFLGVKNLRDGTPYAWALPEYIALAQMGVKFDLGQVNVTAAPFTTVGAAQDTQRADTLEEAVPGSVESMEGANEYNINNYTLDGQLSYGNLDWGILDDEDLQAAVEADPLLAGVPVLAAATGDSAVGPFVGPYVDASNAHIYGGVGQQLASGISAGIAAAEATAPGDPVEITEIGISSSGYGTAPWGVTDAVTQGIIDTNALLDGYQDGAAKVFLYDLMDDDTNTAQENDFGLFDINGSPKPAAVDISNLIKLLSDSGPGSEPPGALAYSISGLPATASSMLLEKSSGIFDIVFWNGSAQLYNGTADVTPPAASVTLTLGHFSDINIYDPVQGLTPIASNGDAETISFALSEDPIVVEVGETTACYCPGTRILTENGELAVESLRIGDFAMTLSGAPRPIRWIGRRSYDGSLLAGNVLMLPVCIKANAIETGVPARDLWVSPGHAIYLDCVLIPAWRLINGVSVIQPAAADQVTYLHVELEDHEVILAENCPAESFLDDNCRNHFNNAAEFHALYPGATPDGRPSYARRVEEGFELQAIQSRIAARAGIVPCEVQSGPLRGFVDQVGPELICGWAQDTLQPEEPVVLDIIVSGRRATRVLANGYRADLRRAGLGTGAHAFTTRLPVRGVGGLEVRRASDQAQLRLTDQARSNA